LDLSTAVVMSVVVSSVDVSIPARRPLIRSYSDRSDLKCRSLRVRGISDLLPCSAFGANLVDLFLRIRSAAGIGGVPAV
jgi:hypothetical protein